MANSWTGSKVRLRAWESGDWQAQARWREDTEGERADFAVPFSMSLEATRQQAEEYALRRPENDNFNWIIEALTGEVVGTINSNECDLLNGTFSYGIYVAPEFRRNGYASEAILILLRYFFDERRYQKANAGVYDYNEASIRLHEKLGFVLEGRSRRMQFSAGAHHNLLRFGMTVEEFLEMHGQRLGGEPSSNSI